MIERASDRGRAVGRMKLFPTYLEPNPTDLSTQTSLLLSYHCARYPGLGRDARRWGCLSQRWGKQGWALAAWRLTIEDDERWEPIRTGTEGTVGQDNSGLFCISLTEHGNMALAFPAVYILGPIETWLVTKVGGRARASVQINSCKQRETRLMRRMSTV